MAAITGAGNAAEAGASDAAIHSGAEESRPRRRQNLEVKEVIDELAQEVPRTSLLDRLEQQLKGQTHVSRLLFGFTVVDDKKIHHAVEQELNTWRTGLGGEAEELSGVLIFMGQVAVQLLEGPTELLFKALLHCNELTGEGKSEIGAELRSSAGGAAEKAIKPALISSIRVLYLTELHGVRCSRSWCSCSHPAKLQGNQVQLAEGNCADLVFSVYKKLLMVCLKAQEHLGSDKVTLDKLHGAYRRVTDLMPSPDEVALLLGKAGAEFFFSFQEFEKLFIAPLNLVLHSELLWPMPPPLRY